MEEKPKGIDWSAVWKWFTVARIVGLVLLGFGLVATIGTVEELRANAGAELISIALTVLVIDALNERRATQQEKRRLILQMGSPDNAFAVEAARILRARDWLEDGSLKGVYLARANLEGAHLNDANLEEAHLDYANLQGAGLRGARLQGAILWRANLGEARLEGAKLQGAILWEANLGGAYLLDAKLQGAELDYADLQGARLGHAKLQGARLHSANLQGAILRHANFDESTTLPDETKWTPDTDMARFTDPEHPEFWRSDDPRSPAYRGDDDDGDDNHDNDDDND